MATRNDRAIVCRVSDYSETSQVVTLFTEANGQVRLMAKGLRRGTRNRPGIGLDLMETGDAAFVLPREHAGLGTLTEWVQRDAQTMVRSDLTTLYAGLYGVELLASFTAEHDPHPGMFECTEQFLARLNREPGVGAARHTAMLQFLLLREAGFLPLLDACTRCRRVAEPQPRAYFSALSGGRVCYSCRDEAPDREPLPPSLRENAADPWVATRWATLFDRYISSVLGRPVRGSGELFARLHAANASAD